MADLFKIVHECVSELMVEAEQDSSLSGHRFTAEEVHARSEELDGIELKEIENALHQISEAGGGIVSKGFGETGRKFWGFGIARRAGRRAMTGGL